MPQVEHQMAEPREHEEPPHRRDHSPARADLPVMLSVAEVARHLRVGRKTVCRLIKSGRLRATQYFDGAPYRVFPESVASFLGVGAKGKKTASQKERNARLARAVRARFGVEA
jgi:excisionase family DNA binding protein